MKPIRIGVIGMGGMGGRHVRNLTNEVAEAQVVALADVDQVRMKEVAAFCGATHTFSDGNALIHHPDVEAVLIAAPDRFHAAYRRDSGIQGGDVEPGPLGRLLFRHQPVINDKSRHQ